MSPVPTRRSWQPGAALLVASIAVAGLAGFALGVRSMAWYGGFAAAALLLMGWVEKLRAGRRAAAPAPSKIRGKLKVIEGGKARTPYDLEKDKTTDSQRYLM
jgi:hypothetical protein